MEENIKKEKISFDDLPNIVYKLICRFDKFEQLLLEKSNDSQPEPDRWLDLNELVEYDPAKRKKGTFYGKLRKKELQSHRDGLRGKHLFLKSEFDQWVKEGGVKNKRKISADIAAEADEYLSKKRKG